MAGIGRHHLDRLEEGAVRHVAAWLADRIRARWSDILLLTSVAAAAAACVFSVSVHHHAWHASAAANGPANAVERRLSDLVTARCLKPETPR